MAARDTSFETASPPPPRSPWKPESPFLETYENEPSSVAGEFQAPALYELETPFASVYEFSGEEGAPGVQAEEFVELVDQLHDEEFDEALLELVHEASALYEDRFESEFGEPPAREFAAEEFLRTHFRPLLQRSESLIDSMAEGVRQRDVAAMTEAEIDNFLNEYEPSNTQLSPNFEYFLKGLWKKAKKAVKGAVNLAQKGIQLATKLVPGLGAILEKLKQLARPLIDKVLKMAINKLPAALQPVAQQLAAKFLQSAGVAEAPEEREEEASPDVCGIQKELDAQVAHLLLVPAGPEQEVAVAQYAGEAGQTGPDVLGHLHRGRARFVKRICQLKEGEDPRPEVENFIPAILPALKLGISLVGRPKVVNFLAGFVAKLIKRFVGPTQAPVLSRAMVDAGLRLISLEAAPQDEAQAAGNALASTVEDTVRRVAALPGYELDNEALLEAAALEAFETAAAANFPPALLRPELREASDVNATWVALPPGDRKRYKKYTKIFEVTVTPQTARAVKTFDGTTLADFFRDQLGLQANASVKARMHLYEAIPGTWLSRISRREKVPGLSSSAKSAWSQIHPLTPEAAGFLLSQPGLGAQVSGKFLSSRDMIAVGQRFYYLEIATPTGPRAGIAAGGRSGEINVTLDFPRNQIRLFIFLSEASAQEIAVQLRQSQLAGAWKLLKSAVAAGLATAFRAIGRHVKVVHEAVPPEQFVGAMAGQVLRRVGPVAIDWLINKLLDWLYQAITAYYQQRANEFIAATEAPADGVTLVVALTNPPGLSQIRRALRGEPFNPLALPEGVPTINVKVVAGFRRNE